MQLTLRSITPWATVMLIAGLLALQPSSSAWAAAPGVIEKTSASDFDHTVQKLKSAISANKLVLLKDFNHQMMVKMVGVNADKSMSFEVFHPRYGKVLNEKNRAAFMIAPVRIMVQQDGDDVVVLYQEASVLLEPYGGLDGLGKELDTLIANIVGSATE
jgi:uncharacterized protein (DUF302 family)